MTEVTRAHPVASPSLRNARAPFPHFAGTGQVTTYAD
jgi:hypothetical protein